MGSPARRGALSVVLVLDYSPDYLGGAQTSFAEQIALIAIAGFRITVVTPPSPALTEHCRRVGARHHAVPASATLPGLGLPIVRNTGRLRDRLESLLLRVDADVLHVHSELGLAVAAIDAAGRLKVPVVMTVHTIFWRAPRIAAGVLGATIRGGFRAVTGRKVTPHASGGSPAEQALRGMTGTVAALADVVISPSAHQAEVLRGLGLPRVSVLPNSARPVPQQPLPAPSPLRVLWAGRCEPEKRPLEFLEAVRLVQRHLPPRLLEVTVAGSGSLLGRARRRRIPGVEIVGRVTNSRMGDLLAAHHLFAITSYGFDNQPMTIVEAVSAGRGVIVCDPSLREGLEGAGVRSDPDPRALANRLVDLVSRPDRVRVLAGAAATDRTFSPARFISGLAEAYASVEPSGSYAAERGDHAAAPAFPELLMSPI